MVLGSKEGDQLHRSVCKLCPLPLALYPWVTVFFTGSRENVPV